jgi:hypothetical protein
MNSSISLVNDAVPVSPYTPVWLAVREQLRYSFREEIISI